MKIGVIIAMDEEFQRISELIGNKTEGQLGVNYLILRHCGVGKVNAAMGAVELIKEENPDCVISTGVAGGIDAGLNVLDVVVSDQMVYHDVDCGDGWEYGQIMGMPARYYGEKKLYEAALKLNEIQDETRIKCGMICTGDQFITNREALDKIKSKFPEGLAVDMESCAIAQVCHKYNVPFVSFRIISDTPGNTENHAAQWADFWAEMSGRSFRITKRFFEEI